MFVLIREETTFRYKLHSCWAPLFITSETQLWYTIHLVELFCKIWYNFFLNIIYNIKCFWITWFFYSCMMYDLSLNMLYDASNQAIWLSDMIINRIYKYTVPMLCVILGFIWISRLVWYLRQTKICENQKREILTF